MPEQEGDIVRKLLRMQSHPGRSYAPGSLSGGIDPIQKPDGIPGKERMRGDDNLLDEIGELPEASDQTDIQNRTDRPPRPPITGLTPPNGYPK